METVAGRDVGATAPEDSAAWALPKPVSPVEQVRRFARRKPLGFIAILVIIVMGVIAAGAPVFDVYDPHESVYVNNPQYDPNNFTDIRAQSPTMVAILAPPSASHWLGTEVGGYDTWSNIVWGTRRSLGIGISALLIATAAGVVLGVLSGFFGGALDLLLQRLLDAIQCFPPLLLLILVASTRGTGVGWFILALGFIATTQVSRIVRSTVLSTREMPYVEAARVVGASDLRVMARHIVPNVFAPVIVIFSIGLGTVIIAEASLSFLGLAPPGISWGEMLSEGRNVIQSSPWLALFSGAAITLAVLAFNVAGDALRDVLDPRLRI